MIKEIDLNDFEQSFAILTWIDIFHSINPQSTLAVLIECRYHSVECRYFRADAYKFLGVGKMPPDAL